MVGAPALSRRVGQGHAEQRDGPADEFERGRPLAQPDECDGDGHGRDEVEARRGLADVEAGDGVGPGQESDGRRHDAEVAGLREQIVGRVSIAAFPSAAAALLPGVWSTLTAEAPYVEPQLVEMEPEESLPAVVHGEVDVAVAHEYDLLPRPLDPAYERRELLTDPVLVAVHRDHPAADSTVVDLGCLSAEAFLAPRTHTSCAEMTLRACAQAGFVPHVAARAEARHPSAVHRQPPRRRPHTGRPRRPRRTHRGRRAGRGQRVAPDPSPTADRCALAPLSDARAQRADYRAVRSG
ncbi:MAG TPA: LysR substrate-binding domain-containing protein [Mycobacteriales bacterium]